MEIILIFFVPSSLLFAINLMMLLLPFAFLKMIIQGASFHPVGMITGAGAGLLIAFPFLLAKDTKMKILYLQPIITLLMAIATFVFMMDSSLVNIARQFTFGVSIMYLVIFPYAALVILSIIISIYKNTTQASVFLFLSNVILTTIICIYSTPLFSFFVSCAGIQGS